MRIQKTDENPHLINKRLKGELSYSLKYYRDLKPPKIMSNAEAFSIQNHVAKSQKPIKNSFKYSGVPL